MTLFAPSVHGVPIRLSDERWNHIVTRHPELAGTRTDVMETVAAPNFIQLGDAGEFLAIRLPRPKAPRYLVVVYREIAPDDGFVITAYLTREPNLRRRVVWTR